eukprot:COSAG06_NODE_2770_length_6314_cov_1.878681_4_plen_147_part_00
MRQKTRRFCARFQHTMINATMILPRQAWNKRKRKTLKNDRSMVSADSHCCVDDSRRASSRAAEGRSAGKKTQIFCAVSILKMIILPRQARDKHRENSKKRDTFAYRRGFLSTALDCSLTTRRRCSSRSRSRIQLVLREARSVRMYD